VVTWAGNGAYNRAVEAGGNASVTLALPAGLATSDGDLLLALISLIDANTGAPTAATPVGWNLAGNTTLANNGGNVTKTYLFWAFNTAGLTLTFTASGFVNTSFGIEGVINGFHNASGIGNFTSVTPGGVTTTAIPGPAGFTAGQMNFWGGWNYLGSTVSGTSPTLSNTFFNNTASFSSVETGTTTPGSAPGTETITWNGSAGNYQGVGLTINPANVTVFNEYSQSIFRLKQGWRF
jgi:hypothetical protein